MTSSIFDNIPEPEADPIFEYHQKYLECKNENKLNLTLGMIYDKTTQKLKVLESVKKAEKIILDENLNKEYPPMLGVPEFVNGIQNLIFPPTEFKDANVLTVQTITGGGALRSGSEFISNHFGKKIYVSNKTFSPYYELFSNLEIGHYPYYDEINKRFDFENLKSFLENLENDSVLSFQLSSHNPTGLDPSEEQWEALAEIIDRKNHFVFFDIAYLGYANKSVDKDLFPVRHFQKKGIEMLIAVSTGKMFLNYSDDVGTLIVVSRTPEVLNIVKGHIIIINRGNFSFSSLYGARVAGRILNNPELRSLWESEMKEIWNDIDLIRNAVIEEIGKLKENRIKLELVKSQKGIYLYFDLNKDQVDKLIEKYSVFVVLGGRVNISSIPLSQVSFLVNALNDILA